MRIKMTNRESKEEETFDTRLGAHSIVARTGRRLAGASVGRYGLLKSSTRQLLDISVGQDSLSRALKIMDVLVKRLEEKGLIVRNGSLHKYKTVVTINGEEVPFSLREKVKRVEHVLTDKEKEYKKRYGESHAPKFDFVPTGKLVLRDEDNYGIKHQKTIGTSKPIEHYVKQFIERMFDTARLEKERRERWEENERKREEGRKKRQENIRLQQEELQRIKTLESEVDFWHRSRRIREYLRVLEETASRERGDVDPDSELGKWLRWAYQQADRFDPLAENPPSILDEQRKREDGY